MDIAEIIQRVKAIPESCMPGQSVDCVIIGYQEGQLFVLLNNWLNQGFWSLPGGFVRLEEHMDVSARRILLDLTGLDQIFLRQFHTFGAANRGHYRGMFKEFVHSLGIRSEEVIDFLEGRFISTAYYALVNKNSVQAAIDALNRDCVWVPAKNIPNLILDHDEIIERALQQIRIELNYLPLGRELLSERFTMTELRGIYESILGRTMDRGNFQRKMLRLGHLQRHDEQQTGQAHRAPYLYSFESEVYSILLEEGIGYF